MAECIPQLSLNFHPTVPLTVSFDAPHISSDGGVLLLRQMDDRLGLSERLAALLPDVRDPRKVKHARREQMRQRLYQIALGYADCNDADRLRQDPLLKVSAIAVPRPLASLRNRRCRDWRTRWTCRRCARSYARSRNSM